MALPPDREKGLFDTMFDLIPWETRPRNKALFFLAGLVALGVGLAFLATTPVHAFTFGSEHAYLGVIHGTLATLYLLAATAAVYLAYRLYSLLKGRRVDLQGWFYILLISALVSFLLLWPPVIVERFHG